MAFLVANFFSNTLERNVVVNVILPTDKRKGVQKREKFKTLYLLHGLTGNHNDWIHCSGILRWAQEKNLAVVMPSGENAYYIDNPISKMGEFIGEEILEATRKMFPLSSRREDTFIAGLSMGGYGAIRNGLVYHYNYGYIAGLSSALRNFEQAFDVPERNKKFDIAFGEIEEAAKTDKNPRVAMDNLVALKKENPDMEFPKVYMACGTEDRLIDYNRLFRDLFQEKGFDITYEEEKGGHTWDFWNKYIRHILEWLPLDDTE